MKKREFDIFGLLVGLVIGCILGFFLSTKINLDIPKDKEDEDVLAQAGNVYLLQIEKTTSPSVAESTLINLKNKNLFAVAVTSGINYYIYGGIADSEEDLQELKNKFSSYGYNVFIKKEYILDKPNSVIDNTEAFNFYTECVSNLINSLKGSPLEISDTTKANPINLELFSAILTMNTIQNENLLSEVRLSIYEMITEALE